MGETGIIDKFLYLGFLIRSHSIDLCGRVWSHWYVQCSSIFRYVTYTRRTQPYYKCIIGADAGVRDSLGFNAIIHSAQFGSVFVLHYLLSNAKV